MVTSASGTSASGTSAGTGGACGSWWDENWGGRIAATLDNSNGAEELSGFVVPIDFAGVELSGTQERGDDIRVVGEDGAPLPFELEAWRSAAGGVVWVRLPTLRAQDGAQRVYVYFDNPDAAPVGSSSGVWEEYAGVWHLALATMGQMANSAPPDTNGALTGTSMVAGVMAGARRFTPDEPSRLDFDEASVAWFSGWEAMSVSIWIYPDFPTDADWVEGNGRVITGGGPIWQGRTWQGGAPEGRGRYQLDVSFTGQDTAYLNCEIPRQAWSWIVYDFDGSTLRLYLDGELVADRTGDAATLAESTDEVFLGGQGSAIDGILDEFRVASVSRSAEWYAAQHRAMTGAMVQLGDVERCD